MHRTILVRTLVLVLASAWAVALPAAGPSESFRYREGVSGPASLKYISGLPVLTLSGSPGEIGRQAAALTSREFPLVLDFPRKLLRAAGREDRWPALLATGRQLLPQFPPDHLAELDAFARAAQTDRDLLVGVNTMVDAYRGGFGCSSLIVEPNRSKTGGPLFGRNLDFFTLGTLQKYSLVTVYRPNGKHAFASIGFPGMFGCLSGVNDAGLALATHEVFFAGDGAPLFDRRGTPYTLLFRRVLEECTTVEEAEKLIRSTGRTTLFNLALCDRRDGLVIEATPRTVAVRRGDRGILACANHFCTPELATIISFPKRYRKLLQAGALDQLGLSDVASKLHEVSQPRFTLQTMIFEPAELRLHLAIGACPSSSLPLRTLDLKPFFEGRGSAGSGGMSKGHLPGSK